VLIAGLLIQAVAAGTFIFVSRLGEFYAVAATFGFAYGGVMPLYAVSCARILRAAHPRRGVRRRRHGVQSRNGARSRGGRLDLRPLRRYTWLYVGSFAVGIGAVGIALAFPPFRRANVDLAPA